MHSPVIIHSITAVRAVHFPLGHFHLVLLLLKHCQFCQTISKVLLHYFQSHQVNVIQSDLEMPLTHLEMLAMEYVSAVVSSLKISHFINV